MKISDKEDCSPKTSQNPNKSQENKNLDVDRLVVRTEVTKFLVGHIFISAIIDQTVTEAYPIPA